ncbi:hypothetical protein AO286_19190 [Pseudomonas syringae]|nr:MULTISPECIES: hypothetical protein [Pseudomonas syringae group]PHN54808.1 hypothetical protein AO286_19190 [Pseudomonas syringae]RMR17790.1 hypothetical protein ALP89_02154 [Pseudomonas syringae pv. persicae]
MTPSFTILDLSDVVGSAVESLSNRTKMLTTLDTHPYLLNLLLAKLGEWASVTTAHNREPLTLSLATLGYYIAHILKSRSREQVIRIDASPVVASMAHIKTFGYFANGSLIHGPVRVLGNSGYGHTPVAIGLRATCPLQAINFKVYKTA